MAIETSATAIEAAKTLITEAAVLAPNKEKTDKPETIVHRHSRRYNVTQAPYIKFMKSQGISPDTLDLVTSSNRAWNTASAAFSAEKMEEMAPEAVKDKEYVAAGGMKSLQCIVATTVKDGSSLVGVKAFSENPIPASDEVSQKYGVVSIRHKVSVRKSVDMETADGIAVSVESLVKGKF